ncbi:hypothetical protein AWB94_07645 [Mycolicibacterium canariasense]|nr:hypothetical protein AWB94_07645 [Mycolicibacterium canariasense]
MLRTAALDSAAVITVNVKPGSKKGPLVQTDADGALTIYVQERAVDGKANEAVIKLLAAHLGVPKTRLQLVSGAGARVKRFRVTP